MIWLIGCKGMLGTEISLLFEKQCLPFIGTDREVDITNLEELEIFIQNNHFEWIINCAAYTAVDKAEDDKENCYLINCKGAENIAVISNKINAKLIHISTDYVFNGKGSKPYTEDDTADPIGVYGLSKYEGETKVFQNNPCSLIIRTAWLYGIYGNNFVKTMLRLMNERDELKVVNDQRGSPTWAYDLANVIITIIQRFDSGKNIPFGIYHYTNEGEITWNDFANEIYKQGKELNLITKNCEVKPCTSSDFPAKVKRPAYSVLNKFKIKNNLEITIPEWENSLLKYLKNTLH